MSGRPGTGSVVVVAPDDRLSRLLITALAALPGVADCRFVAAPDRAGYLQLAEAPELAEGLAGGAVLVCRPPCGGASGAGLPDRADAEALLAACDRRRPAAVVLVASAAAVEPRHDHPGHSAELPRLPVRHPVARAWTEQSTSANLLTPTDTEAAGFAIAAGATFASTLAVTQDIRIQHVDVTINDTALLAAR